MKIRQLEAFRAVILRQTVTRAAQMLHVSQPAVTRLLNDLEADVGFALFDRSNGRLQPTPEALVLFDEVQRSFAGMERIAQTAEQIKSLRRGSLHIAGAPAIALDFLPIALTRFLGEHAGINTTLLVHASNIVVDMVLGRRCDVGFIAHPITHAGLHVQPLLQVPMQCVLPKGHALASRQVREAITPEDLRGEAFVSFPTESDARHDIDRVFAAHGVDRVMSVESQLSAAVCTLVEHGAGVAIIDGITASFARQRVEVRPFSPQILSTYSVVTSLHHPPSQLAQAFVEHVRAMLDAQGLSTDFVHKPVDNPA
ncbi:LysR family transcriptional regulator [Pandoraea pneumonica]|jgi:DNA-binding transcriptional LysR family regulator|uniref:LysR family transcriptional regulator n=1 Tax=Pandoraea pneumonica TaxID=2508299 RepID=A0A5E4U0A4_9BURK|nr:LysR substrate-binding domain-containing protein [Pandoraea pneumonica]VVD93527.1 LysR family transcriptional regulator [Pandoraea pneumonica]